MISTYNESKEIYYEYTKAKEVWGNYMCKLRFFDFNDNLVYSRNVWYHHINVVLKKALLPPIFVFWAPGKNIALVYEFERPTTYDLTVIDFDRKVVYRQSLLSKEADRETSILPAEGIIEYVMRNNPALDLVMEKVNLSLFSCWKK